MSIRRIVTASALAFVILPGLAHAGGRAVVPIAWQKKLQNSPWDLNHNQVDDTLDALGPSATADIIVDLNSCLDTAARARLGALGVIDYEAVNFPIVHMAGVPKANLLPIVQDPVVAFIENDDEVHHTLDISNPALQVKPSTAYPPPLPPALPITIHEKYPGIFGASAAVVIVDAGIDDQLGPGTTHESLDRFNGGLDCPLLLTSPCVETDPDDQVGTGTYIAGIVLGRGEGGVDAPHQGLAPQASLVDVKITGALGIVVTSRLIRALDAVANRVGTIWQIQTVLVPWARACRASDGTDALSQAVNQLWGVGETVITGMGNCSQCRAPAGPCASCPCSLVTAPAAADNVIAVGYTDDHGTVSRSDDTLSDDSLRGPRLSDNDAETEDERKPDIVAPGTRISSAKWNTTNEYREDSGTSAAAAHAAGCSALAWDIANKRAPDLKMMFAETADHNAGVWDPGWGAGSLNCFGVADYINNYACASAHFVGACGGFGQPDCGLHPGLHARDWPVEGVANVVTADLTNDGPGFTLPFKLRMRIDSFSNGDQANGICTVDIDPIPPGGVIHPSCAWTPAVSGSPPGVVHACLYADIDYPSDCSDADNHVQHNEEIAQAFSPASAAMYVENPSNEAVTVELQGNFDCGGTSCQGWSFSPNTNFIPMQPDDCPVEVVLSANPISVDAVRRAQVHVKALGHNQSGGTLDLGSVTLTASLACPPRNFTWVAPSTSLMTWLPPIGRNACVNTTFDIARGPLPLSRYPSTTLRGDYTSATCLADELSTTSFDDPTIPPVGGGFFYVVRSGGATPGSWDIVDLAQKGRADDTMHLCAYP